jgi:hypothetical protein
MARTMARPRPAPPDARARALSARRNRSNASGQKGLRKSGAAVADLDDGAAVGGVRSEYHLAVRA